MQRQFCSNCDFQNLTSNNSLNYPGLQDYHLRDLCNTLYILAIGLSKAHEASKIDQDPTHLNWKNFLMMTCKLLWEFGYL